MKKKELKSVFSRVGALFLSICLLVTAVPERVYAAPESEEAMTESADEKVLLHNTSVEPIVESKEVVYNAEHLVYQPFENASYALTYTVSEDGVMITGCTGNFLMENLVLPEEIDGVPVTGIGDSAFSHRGNFTGELIIPSGVTYIGNSAFFNASNFSGNLVIPSGVTYIGQYAFYGCTGFSGDLMIPSTVTDIGDSAFSGCSGFDGKLFFSSGLTSIGATAFFGCSGFSGDLMIPSGVTYIGSSAFSGCSGFNGDLILPESLTNIEPGTFVGCSGFTGKLNLPTELLSIGDNAFYRCTGFSGNLDLPAELLSIGESAFYECYGFNELKLPAGLTSIGEYAFYNCYGFSGDLVIPSGVNSISKFSFSSCSGFDGELILPLELLSIEEDAFSGCSGFSGELSLPSGLTSIGDSAFAFCSGFSGDLVIPSGITSIGDYAFLSCSGFNGELSLPIGLNRIGESSFSNCNGLKGELNLPSGITSIGDSAFSGCSGFSGDLIIPLGLTDISEGVFAGCSGFCGDLVIPSGVTCIGYGAFKYCYGLDGELSLPSELISIGDGAFYDCNFSGELNLPTKLTSIGANAFSGCYFSGELKLPSGLTSIGEYAFSGCHGFSGGLDIPSGITNLGDYTFNNCSGLNGELKLSEGLTSIGNSVFTGCEFIGELNLPSGLTSIGEYAFYYCNGFDGELKLPSGLTSIGSDAFGYCFGFEGDLNFPETLNKIGSNAFSACVGLSGRVLIPSKTTQIEVGAFDFNNIDGVYAITVYAPKGSYAESFAQDNGFSFVEWNGGSLDNPALPDEMTQEAMVPREEAWILIIDENAMPITDAQVKVTKDGVAFDEYVYEDGVVKIQAGDDAFGITVSASKEGLVSCNEYFLVKGGDGAYIKLYPAMRESTLTSVVLKETGTNLLKEDVCVKKSETSYITLSVATSGTRPNYYAITRNGIIEQEIFPVVTPYTDELEINVSDWQLTGGEIGIIGWHYGENVLDQTKLFDEKIHLEIINDVKVTEIDKADNSDNSDTTNGEKSLKLWNDPFTFTVDKKIPIMGGAKLTIDSMIDLPVRIEFEGKKAKVYVGKAYSMLENKKEESKESKWASLKNSLKNEMKKAQSSSAFDRGVVAGFDVTLEAAGYGEGYVSDTGETMVTLGLFVKVAGSNGITWYTFVGPVPVYAELNGEIGASVEGKVALAIKDGKLISGELDMDSSVAAEVTVGVGAGLNDLACVEVNGNAKLEWIHKFVKSSTENKNAVNLELGMKARAVLLFLSYEQNLVKTTWQLYPKFELLEDYVIGQDTPNVLKASDYHVLTRSYLMAAAGPDVVKSSDTANNDAEILINGLYPDAKPQVAVYDGVNYLFYLDDQAERGDEDRTALVYRKENASGWSEPVVVNDDSTADFDYEIAVGADGIYVVWQNAIKSMAGISTLNDAAACLELQAAKVAGNTVTMLHAPAVTKGIAPLSPSVVCDGTTVWTGWYENSENDLLQNNNGTNVIYAQMLGTEKNGERETLAETDMGVSTLDFGMLGEKLYGAFTADTDNDMNTTADREVYLAQGGTIKRLTENETMDSNPQFGMLDGKQVVLYYADGNFVYTDGSTASTVFAEQNSTISDHFVFVSNCEKPVIAWKDAYIMGEDAGQALTVTNYENSSWAEPFQAVTTKDSLVAFTVVQGDSDDVVADLLYTARGELNGQEITRLYGKAAKGSGNVNFVKLEYDENAYDPEKEFPMAVTLENSSSYSVNVCKLVIKNAEGKEVFSQAVTEPLAAGAEQKVTLNGFAPEDSGALAQYTLLAYADGRLYDRHEFALGGVDFVLSDKITYDANEELLNLKVTNQSNFADDVKLSIYAEDSDTPLYVKEYAAVPAGCSVNYVCKLQTLWEQTESDALVITAESLGRADVNAYNNSTTIYNLSRESELVAVTLDKKEATLYIGDTLQLNASVTPENTLYGTLEWSSNNENCVSVDANGMVTAKEAGVATISAITVDGMKDVCVITVEDAVVEVSSVVLDKTELSLNEGEESTLTVTINPDNASDKTVVWSSSDETVATVTDGVVKAIKAGTTTITVTTTNGKTANCKVTVTELKEDPNPEPEPNPKKDVTEIFDDIKPTDWWVSAVQYAYDNNIMTGTGTSFKPTEALTREQFVQVLYSNSGKPTVDGMVNAFSDVNETLWYAKAVLWANKNAIAAGNANGTFGIGQSITREQLALMLYKYAQLNGYDLTTTEGKINQFADGAKVSYYATTALDWAITQGIISGKGTTGADISTFRIDPQGTATRAECAAMMRMLLTGNE